MTLTRVPLSAANQPIAARPPGVPHDVFHAARATFIAANTTDISVPVEPDLSLMTN